MTTAQSQAMDRGQPVLLPPGLHQWDSPTIECGGLGEGAMKIEYVLPQYTLYKLYIIYINIVYTHNTATICFYLKDVKSIILTNTCSLSGAIRRQQHVIARHAPGQVQVYPFLPMNSRILSYNSNAPISIRNE